VSGGPRGAETATLTIMVGGSAEDFARAEPVLQALGRPVHVGGPGAGQAAKLCNNLIAGVTMAAIAEACALATAEGLDPATLYELLTTSTGDSRVLRTRFPLEGADPSHPVASGYQALFALDLIAKDLALAGALAEEQGVSVPLAEAALAAYRAAQAEGLGHLDYSAVYLSTAPAP
jgi:3-hydroxyisobutyrate dehydrogenase